MPAQQAEIAPEDAVPLDIGLGAKNAALHELVFERLRDVVIEGQWEPGKTLTVRGLAAEFGVSTMPAREAIRRLVAMGALELTKTRRLSVATMTEKKLEEIRSARLALEPDLARRACERVAKNKRKRDQLIARLTEIDSGLNEAIIQGNVGDYARQNSRFHMELYRASEAEVLLGLVESLWLRVGPFMRVVIGRLGTSVFEDDMHPKAMAALAAGDAQGVEEAIRADIQAGLDGISGSTP